MARPKADIGGEKIAIQCREGERPKVRTRKDGEGKITANAKGY